MELSKQVVSLDLAKRLKELGVKQESLFWWVEQEDWQDHIEKIGVPRKAPWLKNSRYHNAGEIIYSAFTVAELGVFLPLAVQEKKKTYRLHLSKEEGDFSDEIRWFVEYRNKEHSVILTLLVGAVDAARIPDRTCRYTWRSEAPTSHCSWPRTTRLPSA
jgi:hypothetical protein